MLGYRVYKSGINEEQLRLHVKKKISDREMVDLLGYKEIKSVRSWSVSARLKKKKKS